MIGLVFDVETEVKLERHELYFPAFNLAPGHQVVRRLKEVGLEDRFLGLEHETVRTWREYPETYPTEYRQVAPLLLGSVRKIGHKKEVPYLFWNIDEVLVHYLDLSGIWGNFPVLIASN